MRAFLNGIPFIAINPQEIGEWNVQSYEYISDHPPTTKRLSKVSSKYNVCGLLVGKAATLQKNILLSALAEESIKLVHPTIGIKQVTCVRYSVKNHNDSHDAFVFEIDLIESPAARDDSTVSKITDATNELAQIIERLGARFYESIQGLIELNYSIKKVADLMANIDGLLGSPTGVILPIDEMVDSLNELLELKPDKIFERLKVKISRLGKDSIRLAEMSIKTLTVDDQLNFVKDTISILAVFLHQTAIAKDRIEELLNASSQIVDDRIYLFLWDRWLEAKAPGQDLMIRNQPALVSSYEQSETLDLTEGLSHAAGQPFRV